MMIEPSEYKKIYLSMDIEGLIDKKNTLLKSIEEYEKTYILGNKEIPLNVSPNPQIIYKYHILYLKEIMDLIIDNISNKEV